MKKPSDPDQRDLLRSKIIGLGERSIRKSYYPELQQRIEELEKINKELSAEIAVRKEAEEIKTKLEIQLQQSMKMEAIGTLAGGIAHDFNNILTPIIGYADLARINIEKDCAKKRCPVTTDLDHLLEAAHRARQLVQQILTFSRQQNYEKTPLQLRDVVKEAINLLRSSIPSSIEIQENISSGDGYVLANPTQIHQIVMNLGTNAYNAMLETGGVLKVELSPTEIDQADRKVAGLYLAPGPYLCLKICDNGAGMNRKVIDRIYDPYFTTRAESGGTGMGLAVVHGIVREHKGHISVKSELEVGTTFYIYLPKIKESVVRNLEIHNTEVPRGSESILLVEDEEVVLKLEKAILEELGYQVTSCSTPLKALAALDHRPNSFDLVITDMTMPKMNGAELIREILERQPTMSIILCTGFSELIDEQKALAIGARQYVTKPLIRRDIAVTIRKVLDDNCLSSACP